MAEDYTIEEAKQLYADAKAYGLAGAELLADPVKVSETCNGVGADWMPDAMRKICTALNKDMELAAAIHDMRYAIGGTEEDRLCADAEFLFNILLVIDKEYRWYNPWKYYRRHKAADYYGLLRTFGGKAFNYKEDVKNE